MVFTFVVFAFTGFGATDIVVLWNISIQKGVSVAVPNAGHKIYETVLGFGVCRVTSDLKIVKIRYKSRLDNVESISCIPWQVEVFTLSTRAWRSPYSNLPRKSIQFRSKQVAIDGLVYWLAYDMIAMDVRYNCRYCNLIISFDMTTEEFKEVNLPNSLAQQPFYYLSLSKIRESLVVLGRGVCGNNRVFGVWMMEDGVSSSFRMLFNVDVNAPYASIMGFRKSGEAIIEISKHEHDHAQHVVYDPCTDPKCDYARLVVYEPYSKRMDNLGFEGVKASFFVYPYVETLLLLDQPDLTSSYEYI
ncbi:hypothetical protein QVD17_34591 [Tagetes erecta]|uniref:F-box associated beta-propeller type 1 domain-containing protein n=1 Tax=Tagetes erecta TaxID=13708 RepID=A0AAD8JY13_TARER|nr:hypothetical protein QVD17_34591 [Tagetes erecta]